MEPEQDRLPEDFVLDQRVQHLLERDPTVPPEQSALVVENLMNKTGWSYYHTERHRRVDKLISRFLYVGASLRNEKDPDNPNLEYKSLIPGEIFLAYLPMMSIKGLLWSNGAISMARRTDREHDIYTLFISPSLRDNSLYPPGFGVLQKDE